MYSQKNLITVDLYNHITKFPHSFLADSPRYKFEKSIVSWCRNNCKPGEFNYWGEYGNPQYELRFRNESDRLMFGMMFGI